MSIRDGEEILVLMDPYDIFILIEDLQVSKMKILGRYSTTNEYHVDYNAN